MVKLKSTIRREARIKEGKKNAWVKMRMVKRKIILVCCLRAALNYPEQDVWAKMLANAIRATWPIFKDMLDNGDYISDSLSTRTHEATYGGIQAMDLPTGLTYSEVVKMNQMERGQYCQCKRFFSWELKK